MTKKTILLVDDEPEILELSKEAFEYFGFNVLTALNVSEAVKVINSNNAIDYILSDYMMPVQNGIELVRIIRHQLHLKIPISFLSAYTVATQEELSELNIQKVFCKPLDIDEVVIFIQNALAKT